ncbi:alpha/beta fold hydrolase [Shewanella donghaensis]|uniref:alpha/beta fold hydrolase n=1 Tax=Shewanella donghaensis TaxID=238836 RepID=UPI0011840941|nr:alpha/beta hydrolase [Shewanella donghaensis]
MSLKHKYVMIDDVNIHYVEASALRNKIDAKPCMIFLHGFPEYWGTWQAQLDYFSTEFRVIAPDLPGYNLSDKPKALSFYKLPNLIAFLAKFVGIISPEQPVILVAHDWGGAIAWPLAAFHSHLISKLIILNAAHPSTFTREMINNSEQRQKSNYIHQLISPSAESLLTQNNYHYLTEIMMLHSDHYQFHEESKQTYRKVWQQQGAINGMLQYYRAMPQLMPEVNDSADSIEQSNSSVKSSPIKSTADIKIPNIRINLPTLILWGEQDLAFVNENLNGIEQYVPHCSIVRFANTSHWLQHERPDEVNKAIEDFIND